MASPRTSTVAQAASLVRDQLATVLAALPGPGNADLRTKLIDYLSERQAQRMVAEIFGDAFAETPADVADPLRSQMTHELAGLIRAAVAAA